MSDVTAELEHLKKLAKEDPDKRFDRLYRLLRRGSLLAIAREKIAGNRGSKTPGIDGKTLNDITEREIEKLHQALSDGSYMPQAVRRVYIPKRNGKLRPLGIPTIQDRIVQAGVAMLLEAIYEPIFRKCSHGFRPKRSTITALEKASSGYRGGATWIIEGDITDCFGSIPHGVILNCLRKRIKDERFIDLIRKMLQAGVMEAGNRKPNYSGTPQGGIASPILANIVLHELDQWLESQGVNPPVETVAQKNARSNPRYTRLYYRNVTLRRYLDGQRKIPAGLTVEQIRQELRENLKQLKCETRNLPRQVTFYVRYADDFLVMLCNIAKAEAVTLKARIADWMKDQLGLILNEEKTQITHWREKIRFLGYELRGRANRNGTKWLYLTIPKPAEQAVVAKIKQATRYPQAPEYDVFLNINAVARGWSNYYRYAHASKIPAYRLSRVIFWRTVHYLGKRHRRSLAKVMKDHYARSPETHCKGLYVYKPGSPRTPQNRYFIWHKPPAYRSVYSREAHGAQDQQAYIDTHWADGHSQTTRRETRLNAKLCCQHCGASGVTLYVHHPNRLGKMRRVKKGNGHVASSGSEQETKLLCRACHMQFHYAS